MSKRVLIADDSRTMRRIILRSLQVGGVQETAEAADGEEAVAMFEKSPYDLVLTDWNMPKKSGLAVIREIRSLDATVPIIMVTTESERSRVVEAIKAGVSDYLVKTLHGRRLATEAEKFGC